MVGSRSRSRSGLILLDLVLGLGLGQVLVGSQSSFGSNAFGFGFESRFGWCWVKVCCNVCLIVSLLITAPTPPTTYLFQSRLLKSITCSTLFLRKETGLR